MTDPDPLSTWCSGWFLTDSYAPTYGFAVLREGVVGDVVACVTVETEADLAEVFYLRYDPARVTVDLLAKFDMDQPWSLESSVELEPELADALKEAHIDRDPNRVFLLLLAAEDGLGISEVPANSISELPDGPLVPSSDHLWADLSFSDRTNSQSN